MTETITVAANAVLAKLHNPSRQAKLEAQRILSYMVDGAENTELFKKNLWDGRSSFFDFKTCTFPAGFVHFLLAGMKRAGYGVNLVRKPAPAPLGPTNPKVDDFPDDPRYDYQPAVVEALLKHRAGIAQVATGGGKSKIAKLAYARINRPTLFLTTRSILMYQMKDAFEKDMGVSVSVIGDGQFGHTVIDAHGNERQAVKKMTVGMVQTIVAALKEPDPRDPIEKRQKQAERRAKMISLLSKFELVIGEEAHEAGGQSYYEILRHCKNAHYRLALTATPFMRDDEESNMRLMAAFGPVLFKVPEKLLIDRGILARPYFKIIDIKSKPAKLYKNTDWMNARRLAIVECDERNDAIVREAKKAAEYGLPVMILVTQKLHGINILEKLHAAGLTGDYIFGEDDSEERRRCLNKLRTGEIQVLIGSTILDVGVDVPAVGMVILAGGGKAEVAHRQRIGRGARAKKSGPNAFFVVDFSDGWNKHTHAHAQKRLEIIKSTPGFAEGILTPGMEFDYEGLGLAKVA